LGGIQFTLDADNLDGLYSFSMTDRDGTELNDDDDNDTSFSLTGYMKKFEETVRLITEAVILPEYAEPPQEGGQ